MPYPDVVPGRPQGQWVDIPNSHFDPERGHKLYREYIDELVLGDKLGFDALVVNEHHSTFYSLMPSCSIMAGALAVLTKRAKICVFGTPISLTYPHRLAEEYAMLDVMSGGRLECAFPLGTGMEYWVNPVNPSFARERFRSAALSKAASENLCRWLGDRGDAELRRRKRLRILSGLHADRLATQVIRELSRDRGPQRAQAGFRVDHHFRDGLCRRN